MSSIPETADYGNHTHDPRRCEDRDSTLADSAVYLDQAKPNANDRSTDDLHVLDSGERGDYHVLATGGSVGYVKPDTAVPLMDQGPASLAAAAKQYAARGWAMIPTIGKPAVSSWKCYQTTPPTEAELSAMFSQPTVTGLAVILGSASGGLACRDFDVADSYWRLAERNPLAGILPTVQTARGFHVYFAGPSGFKKLADGEYRADSGHYCLLPPSRHPDGPTYTWLVPLPAGPLPVIDPAKAGLLPAAEQTATQATHPTQDSYSCVRADPCVRADDLATIIATTMPTGPGQRFFRIFDFARQIKGIMPNADVAALEGVVARLASTSAAGYPNQRVDRDVGGFPRCVCGRRTARRDYVGRYCRRRQMPDAGWG